MVLLKLKVKCKIKLHLMMNKFFSKKFFINQNQLKCHSNFFYSVFLFSRYCNRIYRIKTGRNEMNVGTKCEDRK